VGAAGLGCDVRLVEEAPATAGALAYAPLVAGRFQAITPDAVVRLVSALPAGITELGCHPAAGPVEGSTYSEERSVELEVLCDSRVSAALKSEGIELRSFAEVSGWSLVG